MLIKPNIFNAHPVVAVQSTRPGGLSKPPYASLNLGLLVGDREEDVLANRALLCESLGIRAGQLAFGTQVHGDQVLRVTGPLQTQGYDALITNVPGVFLSVFIADCTPVLVYDPVHKACAAIHAGWKGSAGRIVAKTVKRMETEYGTSPADCRAFIGACIGFDAFEVNADVADHFAESEKRYDASIAKFFVDLKAANRQQLLDTGLDGANIEVSPYCTVLNNDLFFSHRKEKGVTGRMMGIIGVKE